MPSGAAAASVKPLPGARLNCGLTLAAMAPDSRTSPPSEPPVPARTTPFQVCRGACSVIAAPFSPTTRASLPVPLITRISSAASRSIEPPAPVTTSANASAAAPP